MAESKSEYELQREARIKRNNEVMEQLGLSDAAEALRATRPKQKKQRTEKLPAAEPARRSTRQRFAPGDPLDAAKSWMASHGFGDSTVTPAARGAARDDDSHKPTTARERAPSASSRAPPKAMGLPTEFADLEPWEHEAFYALREWKRARARELGYNDPCVIMHNRSLCAAVRALPSRESELLSLWGFGERRVEQHGALLLAALEPFRATLAARAAERAPAAEGAPHAAWHAAKAKEELPEGPWADRRRWCADRYGCKACFERGPDASWGPQSQRLLDELARRYGSHEGARAAGWQWHARPNHAQYSHDHKWWPPQREYDAATARGLVYAVPLGTTQASDFIANTLPGCLA